MSIPSSFPPPPPPQPSQAGGSSVVPPRSNLPAWEVGTLLRLWRDAQGQWSAALANDRASPVWAGAELVQALGAERLDALLEATAASSAALVRVLAAQPRLALALELLVAPAVVGAVGIEPGLPSAMQPALPPWIRGAAVAPGTPSVYAPASAAQAWADQALASLRAGRPLPAPFTNILWMHTRPLDAWIGEPPAAASSGAGATPPRLSVALLWQAELLGIEFTGNRAALDIELLVSSPYAMQLARARWPHWDGVIAKAGGRARGWRWQQRRLRYPTKRDPVDVDADVDVDVLRLVAELLWSL